MLVDLDKDVGFVVVYVKMVQGWIMLDWLCMGVVVMFVVFVCFGGCEWLVMMVCKLYDCVVYQIVVVYVEGGLMYGVILDQFEENGL